MPKAELTSVKLPDFGIPKVMPSIESRIFKNRYSKVMDRLTENGLNALIVYADREHCANMSWLTGFDPRFEEALLVIVPNLQPVLFTGPENIGAANASPLDLKVVLHPSMGLMGQDRSQTQPFEELLLEAGLTKGLNIGACGWKYFGPFEFMKPENTLEIPSYMADILRKSVGSSGSVVNAGAIFMDPETGLRAAIEIEELAQMEFAACHTSEALKRVILNTSPGMSEFEAAGLLQPIGLPLSCHTMFSSGTRAWHGLSSPTSKLIERGDAVTCAYGVKGALNCRAGWMASEPEDLQTDIGDYIDRLVAPYFEAVANWLENLQIGANASKIYTETMDRLGDPFFGVALNPGHLIHHDEWMHSPFAPQSNSKLQSGMAIQVDVIPATGSPYFTTNIEDGVFLLDENGRAQFCERWPEAWGRISARRAFMVDQLGIRLHEDVLPVSNLASWLPPFWLSPHMAMAMT